MKGGLPVWAPAFEGLSGWERGLNVDKELFEELLESVKQHDVMAKRRKAPEVGADDVKALRKKLHVSQSQLAGLMDVPKRTVEGWEQGRRQPKGAAKALLRAMKRDPVAVARALQDA